MKQVCVRDAPAGSPPAWAAAQASAWDGVGEGGGFSGAPSLPPPDPAPPPHTHHVDISQPGRRGGRAHPFRFRCILVMMPPTTSDTTSDVCGGQHILASHAPCGALHKAVPALYRAAQCVQRAGPALPPVPPHPSGSAKRRRTGRPRTHHAPGHTDRPRTHHAPRTSTPQRWPRKDTEGMRSCQKTSRAQGK